MIDENKGSKRSMGSETWTDIPTDTPTNQPTDQSADKKTDKGKFHFQ